MDFEDFLDEDLFLPEEQTKDAKYDATSGSTTKIIGEMKKEEVVAPTIDFGDSELFVIRTTANREDQVFDFLQSNIEKKKIPIYSILRSHGMRGYIFIEAGNIQDAQLAVYGVPYARGLLPRPVDFSEIDHMIDTGKREVNIRKNDIVEIISGPFKRDNAKVTRIDTQKEELIVELLEAAVSIPITLKFDAVKVIRRDEEDA